MSRFNYTYMCSPVDDFFGMEKVTDGYLVGIVERAVEESTLFCDINPEVGVRRMWLFDPGESYVFPVYVVKDTNNGTTILFSDAELDFIEGLTKV